MAGASKPYNKSGRATAVTKLPPYVLRVGVVALYNRLAPKAPRPFLLLRLLNTPIPPAIMLVVSFYRGVAMLSERKPKIELTLDMLRNSMNLAFDHLFDENGTPVENRLNAFDVFVDELRKNYCAAHSISRNMRKSLEGGKEDSVRP